MDFLHPDLLSTENLVKILKERKLNISNIDNLNRNEILTIFNKFVVPKCQRNTEKNINSKGISDLPTVTNNHKFNNRKRILPPSEEDYAKKLACVTLNVNGKKRTALDKNEVSENEISPKKKKITWP